MMEDSKKVTPYVRVLGFTNKGKELISEINKRNPKINMITSVKKFIEKIISLVIEQLCKCYKKIYLQQMYIH